MATATAQTTNTPAQRELERRMLRQMLLIRRFEEKAAEAYALGKIGGVCHLYIGQEGVAGGAPPPPRGGDNVVSSPPPDRPGPPPARPARARQAPGLSERTRRAEGARGA